MGERSKAQPARPARLDVFVPTGAETDTPSSEPPRNGRRRAALSSVAIPLRWPTTPQERRRVARLWRRISMILLQADGKVMRLPAILPDLLIWRDGEVWASNWRLAQEAGGCHEKSVQREVEWFRRRGLLAVSYGWKRNASGQLAKTRLMKLAIPADYEGPIPDLDQPDHTDTRGPDGEASQADTRGPDGMDTRGPITVEENEGEADDAA